MTEEKTDHIIKLEDFSIGYEKQHILLSELNLSIRKGEMIALIGRNGTGKSTLLKSMIGLIPMLAGNCYLDGLPLHLCDLRKRAKRVSYVSSQVSHLPSISVFELVSLGRTPHTGWLGKMGENDRNEVMQALTKVQLEAYVHRPLEQLSDGERQRVMIARAFVQNTPLMVLDEPTAFLDIPNKYDLIHLLTGFRDGGKSIVYSTHDLETAMMCADKLWVIHNGRIFEGAPEDLGISGIFNTIFETTGITFDENTQRFRYNEPIKGSLQLSGEPEKAMIWTRSALERLGFVVNKGGDTHLQVAKSGLEYKWTLSRKEKKFYFGNLYSLACFLKKDN